MSATTAPYSATRRAGDLVFTSGHVGRESDGAAGEGIARQTTLTLEALEKSLNDAGLDRDSVVRTTVYITDMALRDEMNAVYRSFFGEPLPARATVEVGLAPGLLLEIDAVAYGPASQPNGTSR